jgi:hypothetical protein
VTRLFCPSADEGAMLFTRQRFRSSHDRLLFCVTVGDCRCRQQKGEAAFGT